MPALTAAEGPGAAALRVADRTWAATGVERAARALAGVLADAPPGPVAHMCGLGPAAAAAILGIARAGRAAALAHPVWSAAERAAFLDTARPAVAITDPDAAGPGPGWFAEGIELGDLGEVAAWRRPSPAAPVALPPGTDVLLWTSGSEGRPRVVCHGWDTLGAGARAANLRLAFDGEGTWLATLAWAHVGGLACWVRAALAGARLAFGPRKFEPRDVLAALDATGATHVSLVPVMLRALLDLDTDPPPALRVALLGGAATPPRLVRRALDRGWPIALTYGLTEAGSQVMTAAPADVEHRPDSVGRPLEGMEVRASETGEIEVRGPALARGILGAMPTARDAWLGTGDLGEADEEGRWTILGRLATRIVTGGANVDPGEVERALAEHPDVRDVCVLGVPDPTWGEIVAAVIQPQAGREEGLDERLDRWVRTRLSGPRIPRRWLIEPDMPRTPTGKADRARLGARLAPTGDAIPDPAAEPDARSAPRPGDAP